jgi:WhiB family redox-sensing transcriptional regulator
MSVSVAARAAMPAGRHKAPARTATPTYSSLITASGPVLQQIAQPKAVCARPVRQECLRFVLATHQVHGVWGGTSEDERQLLRSRGPDGMPGYAGAGPAAWSGACR